MEKKSMYRRAHVIGIFMGTLALQATAVQPDWGSADNPPPRDISKRSVNEKFKATPLTELSKLKAPIYPDLLPQFERLERDAILAAHDRSLVKEVTPELEREVRDFLCAVADGYANSWKSLGNEEITKRAMDLEDRGAFSPLVKLFGSLALVDYTRNGEQAGNDLAFCLSSREVENYPSMREALALIRLGEFYGAYRRTAESEAAYAKAMDVFIESAINATGGPIEERYLWLKLESRLHATLTLEAAGTFAKRLASTKGVPEWLGQMAMGEWQSRMAWHHRGSGYANTVTAAGWQKFDEHLAVAAKHFEKAHALCPDRPEAAANLIAIAMAGGQPAARNERFWFEQAVRAQFDYYPAYKSYIWSLRPRWGGSQQQMLAFGLECAATKRYETEVPAWSTWAVLGVCNDSDNYIDAWQISETAEAALEAAIELEKAANPVARAATWRGYQAAIAYRTQQWDIAKSAIERGIEEGALARFHLFPVDVYTNTLPRGCAATSDSVKRAEEAVSKGDWAAAMVALDEARTLAADQPKLVRDALEHLMARFAVRRGLESSEWQELDTPPELWGWTVIQDRWQLDKSGRMSGIAIDAFGPMMLLSTPLGRRWEAEIELDLSKIKAPDSGVGFLFGYEWNKTNANWMTFLVRPGAGSVSITRKSGTQNTSPIRTRRKTQQLRLACFDGRVSAWLNGDRIYTGDWPASEHSNPGEHVGFCTVDLHPNERFSVEKLRVRRLYELPDDFEPGDSR